jgi:hypothetical protein
LRVRGKHRLYAATTSFSREIISCSSL